MLKDVSVIGMFALMRRRGHAGLSRRRYLPSKAFAFSNTGFISGDRDSHWIDHPLFLAAHEQVIGLAPYFHKHL